MDPEAGKFVSAEQIPAGKSWARFDVGEEVKVKGVPMIIERITEERIMLRPKLAVARRAEQGNRHQRRAKDKARCK